MTYIVQSGDTLWAIAQRFGVTVQAIVAANSMVDTSMLRVGQRLYIPAAGAPGSAPHHPHGPSASTGNWSERVGRLEARFAQLEEIADYHRRQIADLQRRVSQLERTP